MSWIWKRPKKKKTPFVVTVNIYPPVLHLRTNKERGLFGLSSGFLPASIIIIIIIKENKDTQEPTIFFLTFIRCCCSK